MSPEQQAQIKAFIQNPSLSEAVYTLLSKHFLRKRGDEDVNMKAARFIAVELLNDAWLEMEKYTVNGDNDKPLSNVGL